MSLTPKQLHILQHSLGVDQYGQGSFYRNYFVTGPPADDFADCTALVAAGLMSTEGARELAGGDHVFHVTEMGRMAMSEASPQPPKRSRSQVRYQEYRECADCFESFWHFLKYKERTRKSGEPVQRF